MNTEVRAHCAEVRAVSDGDGLFIAGDGIVYGQWADLGYCREMIAPGAFAGSFDEDVVVCANHDANLVLGRQSNGTAEIVDTERSCAYRVRINPDDPQAMSIYAKVKRGDIKGSSFTFISQVDEWGEADGKPTRVVKRGAWVGEMGPVTFPAYPQTTSSARTAERVAEIRARGSVTDEDRAELGEVTLLPTGEVRVGRVLSAANVEKVAAARDLLDDVLEAATPADPEPTDEAARSDSAADAGRERSATNPTRLRLKASLRKD